MVSLTKQGWLSLGVSVTLRLVKTKAVSSLKFKDLSTLCQGKITLSCVCVCVCSAHRQVLRYTYSRAAIVLPHKVVYVASFLLFSPQ